MNKQTGGRFLALALWLVLSAAAVLLLASFAKADSTLVWGVVSVPAEPEAIDRIQVYQGDKLVGDFTPWVQPPATYATLIGYVVRPGPNLWARVRGLSGTWSPASIEEDVLKFMSSSERADVNGDGLVTELDRAIMDMVLRGELP